MRATHLWKFGLTAALTLVWMALPPFAYSQGTLNEWDRKVLTTFDEPVRVGNIVLPAGKYVLKVVDLKANRQVVQISNADENKVYVILMGVPTERERVSDKCEFTFYDASPGGAKALRSWFYHGVLTGIEFPPPSGTRKAD
jgi:hypothetical protein